MHIYRLVRNLAVAGFDTSLSRIYWNSLVRVRCKVVQLCTHISHIDFISMRFIFLRFIVMRLLIVVVVVVGPFFNSKWNRFRHRANGRWCDANGSMLTQHKFTISRSLSALPSLKCIRIVCGRWDSMSTFILMAGTQYRYMDIISLRAQHLRTRIQTHNDAVRAYALSNSNPFICISVKWIISMDTHTQ